MQTVALILQLLLSLALIASILFQTTKSEGLSGTIGGKASATFRGARSGTDIWLEKATTVVAIAWLVGCMLTSFLFYKR